MHAQPKFSVIMATLNSMRTLEAALKALRAQNYPAELVEILVIDGGSTDGTRETALRYGCRVVDNPRVEPVSAKIIGLREARGDYLMHVDSDEVLLSSEALNKRAQAFAENPDVKMVFSSGYSNPPGVPFAACYINEFGDPFSMYYYRLSKDFRFFLPKIRERCVTASEQDGYVVFELKQGPQPILENAACGNCIDLQFFRQHFPELGERPDGPVHFFYYMQKFTRKFAITKHDAIDHFSSDDWAGFLRKIKWRVRNNIFFATGVGAAGFLRRDQFEKQGVRLKKYLYPFYVLLLLPLLADTLALMFTRRDVRYWRHIPLTFYTLWLIAAMSLLRLGGHKPEQKSYGEQRTIP